MQASDLAVDEAEGVGIGHADADGLEGLALARTELYDVLILDVMLPGLDGNELCRKLRGCGISTEPPSIMEIGNVRARSSAGHGY